jgi:hypothetical protein
MVLGEESGYAGFLHFSRRIKVKIDAVGKKSILLLPPDESLATWPCVVPI